MSITDVAGIKVGHWTDQTARTGCTVVLLPSPNVTAVDVRGAAPGSRETALLRPGMRVLEANAIVLAGGSAFGLEAAHGVVGELERQGIGHDTPFGVVPIVPAAVIYDLGVGDPAGRPTAASGASAMRAASSGDFEVGRVGVGTGATSGKWRGFEHAVPTGVFSSSLTIGDATIGSLVVVNAVGDIDPDFDAPVPESTEASTLTNTTLAVLATDAEVSRADLLRLCVRAHDAYAATINPVHTRYDGDAVFAVSCGAKAVDLDRLGEAAFAVTRQAIRAASRQ